MNKELLHFCLDWLSANAPSLVQLLTALVPVMALGVAGYALYVASKKGGQK
ncbi:hypothetical protein I5589_05045 [Burkholderia vietnamiensis]|uniref:Uncharacterized protein n=1 Tax=Burkholderia vietnamiensis TaxID=60552 RepID=A0ABS1AQP2_BURVI|nr:hypothetical protein [Burkholderia vietnamiensis]MBJ9686446.1 hypothetical protein [Burkholderia vietnamiensis]